MVEDFDQIVAQQDIGCAQNETADMAVAFVGAFVAAFVGRNKVDIQDTIVEAVAKMPEVEPASAHRSLVQNFGQ